jgi:hypothetical protein
MGESGSSLTVMCGSWTTASWDRVRGCSGSEIVLKRSIVSDGWRGQMRDRRFLVRRNGLVRRGSRCHRRGRTESHRLRELFEW